MAGGKVWDMVLEREVEPHRWLLKAQSTPVWTCSKCRSVVTGDDKPGDYHIIKVATRFKENPAIRDVKGRIGLEKVYYEGTCAEIAAFRAAQEVMES
ncbi:MAG: hypothetical protein ACRD6W_06060 [Nitrososphaerales archaeon]